MDNAAVSSEPQTSGTSNTTIIACNAISIIACACTLALYFALFWRTKYKRLMRRTSLVLAACMASSDLVLHCANLAGYGPLPQGFLCAWVGGFLFAAPSMLSIFYSCCIALNSQLAFVFHRRPSVRALRYYVLLPFFTAMIISCTTLATGSFGYDQSWGYCWYNTVGVPQHLVLLRIIFTYSLPTLLCILYLVVATITITISVFGKHTPFGHSYSSSSSPSRQRISVERTATKNLAVHAPRQAPTTGRPSTAGSNPLYTVNVYPPTSPGLTSDIDVDARSSEHHAFPPLSIFALQQDNAFLGTPRKDGQRGLLSMLIKSKMGSSYPNEAQYADEAQQTPEGTKLVNKRAKMLMKDMVVRQLTFRLIGYIVAPILCLLPGIVLDLVTKVFPKLVVPSWVNGLLDGLNGLIGLLNSILMLSDPSLLAVWNDVRVGLHGSAKHLCPIRSALGLQGPCPRACRGEQSVEEGKASQRNEDARTGVDNSMFARTRRDEEEIEECETDEAKPDEVKETEVNVEEDIRDIRTHAPFGRSNQPRTSLQVHVKVDVTQRVMRRRQSRVELMEDWLSGL